MLFMNIFAPYRPRDVELLRCDPLAQAADAASSDLPPDADELLGSWELLSEPPCGVTQLPALRWLRRTGPRGALSLPTAAAAADAARPEAPELSAACPS